MKKNPKEGNKHEHAAFTQKEDKEKEKEVWPNPLTILSPFLYLKLRYSSYYRLLVCRLFKHLDS